MFAGSNGGAGKAQGRSTSENGLASEPVLSAQDDKVGARAESLDVGASFTANRVSVRCRSYTPTGCLLPTGTGVSHLYLSGFSPLTMA